MGQWLVWKIKNNELKSVRLEKLKVKSVHLSQRTYSLTSYLLKDLRAYGQDNCHVCRLLAANMLTSGVRKISLLYISDFMWYRDGPQNIVVNQSINWTFQTNRSKIV